MNILVINGHPDLKSFNSAIFKEFVGNLDGKKHKIETLELGKMKFDPVLRYGYRKRMTDDEEIIHSQELVKWADHLVFIYPIWWGAMPSLLKGWVDRVFTPGITYRTNPSGSFLINFITGRQFERLMKGKTATIITTSQGPGVWFKAFSGLVSFSPNSYGIAVLKNAVLAVCGIKTKKIFAFGLVGREENTPKMRDEFLKKIGLYAGRI